METKVDYGAKEELKAPGWLERLDKAAGVLDRALNVSVELVGPPEQNEAKAQDADRLADALDLRLWQVERLAGLVTAQMDRVRARFCLMEGGIVKAIRGLTVLWEFLLLATFVSAVVYFRPSNLGWMIVSYLYGLLSALLVVAAIVRWSR